jgi:Adenylate and Guanylate cyclase catalytic domain
MAELKPSAVTAPAPVRPVIGQGAPRGVTEARAEPIPARKACQQGTCRTPMRQKERALRRGPRASFRRLGQIDGSARRAERASDHRLERFERHRLEVGIERRLIEHAAELFRLFEVGMAAKLFAHIAVKSNEVKEIIALEDAMMLHDPVILSDVVGYSRLTGADEDRILARLRAFLHHGRVVKRTGDGAIVEFRSVVDAVNCAIEVQRAMVERNAEVAPEKRIEFRIGIHVGDVVEETDGDLMGDGVNIAARLEGVCEPGGIVLSGAAYEHARDRLKETFIDLGEHALKNIARPVRVYAVKSDSAGGAPAAKAVSAKRSEPPRLSLVVLPFANIGGDPEHLDAAR